ncbi:MAG: VOC family protein [Phycisphaeraceae bacterium]|jgi:catechol 2,3-dioxygenase-like lactoylglutathione lyase family enzyme|nr:VOC family protein [Phycisphaeraceae bacterium]
MLASIQQVNYVIVLCDDFERMKAFYTEVFAFPVEAESPTDLAMRAGSVTLALRKRTRDYDGHSGGAASPGVQIAFLVAPDEVGPCHEQLVKKGVKILDPPTDQPRGHRTVYFSDPEGNVLEIYAEV